MLSTSGIINEAVLYPVTDYPYRTDAACFKAEVADYVKAFTLDKESQKAAYLYLMKQLNAITIISEPETTDQTKVEWLREHGIIITEEEENDPNSLLMISSLYAFMKNDMYYVFTGEHLTIPEGTRLEAALMLYLIGLSGQNKTLINFIQKYFGTSKVLNLDDYIYYTSLFALFTNGYVSVGELTQLSRDEVYRRVAIMTIQQYGIAIDAQTASQEEITLKYLAAMLGNQYKITIDPSSLYKAQKSGIIAYYILQRMAYEDAKATISTSKYSYSQAFSIVLKKTHRFDLENQFYSDIKEYNVYLNNIRDSVYVNPNPISSSGTTLYINGAEVAGGQYQKLTLDGKTKQSFNIVSRYQKDAATKNSYYKINLYQGSSAAPDSNITGIISEFGTVTIVNRTNSSGETIPIISPAVSLIDGAVSMVDGVAKVLTINDKGQLVDENGNVVSNSVYETLPEGYKYVMNDNGTISIMLIDKEESTTSEAEKQDAADKTKLRGIIIAASSFLFLMLVLIIVIVLRGTNKKRKEKSKTNKKPKKEKPEKQKKQKKIKKDKNNK